MPDLPNVAACDQDMTGNENVTTHNVANENEEMPENAPAIVIVPV